MSKFCTGCIYYRVPGPWSQHGTCLHTSNIYEDPVTGQARSRLTPGQLRARAGDDRCGPEGAWHQSPARRPKFFEIFRRKT